MSARAERRDLEPSPCRIEVTFARSLAAAVPRPTLIG